MLLTIRRRSQVSLFLARVGRTCTLDRRDNEKAHFAPHPLFSSQSAGSVDLIEVLLASHRATLHDFKALSYGPARALA
jgi:hypothetical protein